MLKAYKKFFIFSYKQKGNWIKGLTFEIIRCIFESLQFAALMIALKAIILQDFRGALAPAAFGVMLLSVIGTSIMWKLAHRKEAEASYHTCEEKRIEIGERIKYMPMGFFNSHSLGNITAVATTTMEDMEAMSFAVIVRTLVGVIHACILSIGVMFFDWRIGIIFFLGTAVFILINGKLLKKSDEVSPVRLAAQTKLVDAVLEYIQGMGIVKSFHLTRDANSTMDKTISETEQQNLKVEKLRIPYIALEHCALSVASVCAAFVSVLLYLNGEMELFICLLMMISSFMVYIQLEVAGKMFFMLPMINASIDRVEAVSKSPLMDTDGVEIKPDKLDIVFNHVSFCYEERRVIDDVSLTIPAGTTTAIVGPSGSGKTTLCNLIARFWDVTDGSITLGGTDIRKYSLDSLLSNISMVFQNVYLFNDTIENNIKFGNPAASHDDVVMAAKKACCHEFISALPDGYNSVIGEGGATISGGEKQRISIARAILKNAPIIILDEATANVDPENENELQKAIYELTKSKTVIMIAHRLKTVRNADEIIVIDNGKISQKGTHKELIKQPGIYADFVGGRQKAVSWKVGEAATL